MSSTNDSSDSSGSNVICYCGKKAAMRTSWTNYNPGRRFHGCNDFPNWCGFFHWEDPPMCTRAKSMIPSLLRKLDKKESEISILKKKPFLSRPCEWSGAKGTCAKATPSLGVRDGCLDDDDGVATGAGADDDGVALGAFLGGLNACCCYC
ncbi:UNVERIFIED_CONTAM: hypothetical protein Slati_1154000 [Sesamum latifolium]|uniref:GRF-type domain-containing protein n=1 Tax=Sesamum latifolium TaxID=2727402 RepID=A0AAW2XCF5_9LAMI